MPIEVLPRWLLKVAAVVYVAAVLSLTTGSQPPGRYDIIGNIVLFVPLGGLVMLRWPRVPPAMVVLAGFAVSCGIEVAQLVVFTGRDATFNDIALNTSGTALGWIAGVTFAEVVRLARGLADYERAGKFSE